MRQADRHGFLLWAEKNDTGYDSLRNVGEESVYKSCACTLISAWKDLIFSFASSGAKVMGGPSRQRRRDA